MLMAGALARGHRRGAPDRRARHGHARVRARDRRRLRADARARRDAARAALAARHLHPRALVGVPRAARAGGAQRRDRRADAVVPEHALDAPDPRARGRRRRTLRRSRSTRGSSPRSSVATRATARHEMAQHLLRGTNLEERDERAARALGRSAAEASEAPREVVPGLPQERGRVAVAALRQRLLVARPRRRAARRRARGRSSGTRARAAPPSSPRVTTSAPHVTIPWWTMNAALRSPTGAPRRRPSSGVRIRSPVS